jgi:hypothetical protein
MSSALTRLVFHRILTNRPILHRHLHHAARRPPHQTQLLQRARHAPHIQRRTLLEFLSPPSSGLSRREMVLKRVKDSLDETYKLLSLNFRPPPKAAVLKDWLGLLDECRTGQEMVTDVQADTLLKVFAYLKSDELGGVGVSVENAKDALEALSSFDYGRTDCGMLGKERFGDAYRVLANQLSKFIQKASDGADVAAVITQEVLCYINSGHYDVARPHMERSGDLDLWKHFVKSLRSAEEVRDALALFKTAGPAADDEIISLFTTAFLRTGEPALARQMVDDTEFLQHYDASLRPAAAIIQECMKADSSDTAEALIFKVHSNPMAERRTVDTTDGMKEWLDAFVLHRSQDESWEQVQSMWNLLRSRHNYVPDIVSINMLIAQAYKQGNADRVHDLLEYAESEEIEIDAYTLLPLLDRQLGGMQDVTGALKTWEQVVFDMPPLETRDMVLVMEKLIRALCTCEPDQMNHTTFDELITNHPKYARRFHPETINALTSYYFRNNASLDAVIILKKHAPHFTLAARQLLMSQLVQISNEAMQSVTERDADNDSDPYMAERSGSSSDDMDTIWITYSLLRGLIPETPLPIRTQLMTYLVARGFEQQALQVFVDLREHWNMELRPTAETYIAALDSFTRRRAIRTVHNQLKIDVRVEPSRAIANALIRGYTRAGEGAYALRFWDELVASQEEEGPDEASVVAALEACERANGKISKVDKLHEVWGVVGKRDMAATQGMFDVYARALLMFGDEEESKSVVEKIAGASGLSLEPA